MTGFGDLNLKFPLILAISEFMQFKFHALSPTLLLG